MADFDVVLPDWWKMYIKGSGQGTPHEAVALAIGCRQAEMLGAIADRFAETRDALNRVARAVETLTTALTEKPCNEYGEALPEAIANGIRRGLQR